MQKKNAIDFVLLILSDQSIFLSDHRLVMAKILCLLRNSHRLVSNSVFDNYEDLKSEIKAAADPATSQLLKRLSEYYKGSRNHKTTLTRPKRNGGSIAETPTAFAFFQEFYNELFYSTTRAITTLLRIKDPEELPPISSSDIEHAINTMKLGKKPGPDHITVEMLMAAYHILETINKTIQ
ncbi:hypothetical protein OSTOST_02731 [Ostertagia ostertagi]